MNTVPKDMSSAYHNIMKRIESSRLDDKELAMKVLSWLVRAREPLTMNMLLEALAVEEFDVTTTLVEVLRDNMLTPSDVIECCKSLVICDKSNGAVRFVHFTVQEFIEKYHSQDLPAVNHLAKTCLAYLSLPEFDEPDPNEFYCTRYNCTAKYEFSSYAFRYWHIHTKGEVESCLDVQRAFLYVFGSIFSSKPGRNIRCHMKPEGLSKETLICVIAKLGLSTFCKLLLDGDLNAM